MQACPAPLSKVELDPAHDLDVAAMIAHGLGEPARLHKQYRAIESELDRYPAIDQRAFARRLYQCVGQENPVSQLARMRPPSEVSR
jgi:hypothetical protein